MEFSREDLIAAIKKIDENPSLKKNRSSSTYDLIFEDQKYPPILVLSVANQLQNGKELFLEDFNNNVEEPFNLLRENGFEVVKKNLSYYDELTQFIKQAQTAELKTSKYKKMYFDLNVKVSFGQGVPATIPWISFLRKGVTTANGIYPVYLYYKKENLLILAYGISETTPPQSQWTVEHPITIEEYFTQNNLGKPFRYGKSFIYKVYNPTDLPDKSTIDKELNELLAFYQTLELEEMTPPDQPEITSFSISHFNEQLKTANLSFSEQITLRFIASLTSKPFVILSGLSGSGKTKIAQSFVQYICESPSQYNIVPVGADWTNREPMVGYPNGLVVDEYITPDSGVIHLFLEASKKENENKPFFLILDEMNLSHVERYFADFLSIMESEDHIKLYTGNGRKSLDGLEIPTEIGWPKNVFIIGTVNIDETTYMFSPKVLDRANVIEFRVTEQEIQNFLANPGKPDLKQLKGQGADMAAAFLNLAQQKEAAQSEDLTQELVAFFNRLQNVEAEFGYRSASEMMTLMSRLNTLSPELTDDECFDIAVMQKLLPKLHGSRSKLVNILKSLGALCVIYTSNEDFEKSFDELYKKDFEGITIKYPLSFGKLTRMYKNVLANGFTSYAEA